MEDSRRSLAIGIFDSGMGGLTVMSQIMRKLPNERLVYFGDTARLPYGDKSPQTITRAVIESTIFLMEQNIKLLIVACNTASSYALQKLKALFNIPIIGVIEPGALRALQVTKNQRIAVLGTKATIQSGAYEKKIHEYKKNASVYSIACPLFVPLVEEGMQCHPATKMIVTEYLSSLNSHDVDTILLGCTHYPILKETIQAIVGEKVHIVDSAITCADKVSETLAQQNLQNNGQRPEAHRFFVSDNTEKFINLGEKILGSPIEKVLLTSLAVH